MDRTDAQREAARENGKKGGRPKKDRPDNTELEALGPPPTQPLQLARWCQRALAIDLWRQIQGCADPELSQGLRATAGAIAKVMPTDIMVEAERLIREDGAQLDDDDGPQVESIDTDGQIERTSSLYCAAPRSRRK